MTEITIYTNSEEVNDVFNRIKNHIIRSDKIHVKVGDILNFRLIKNQREIYHQINRRKYVVTLVEDDRTVPIFRHHQIISFKELA